MKLRNKLLIITTIAVMMLIGTGFAAWTFTTAQTAETSLTSGVVTAAIQAENVEVDQTTLYIVCDAPSNQSGLVAGEGIYWATKSGDTYTKVTTITLTGTVTEDDNDIADINTYVGTFTITAGAINGTYLDIAAISISQDVTSTTKDGSVSYTYTLPTLSYATIPTNVSEVNALETEVNALTSYKLTVSFAVKEIA